MEIASVTVMVSTNMQRYNNIGDIHVRTKWRMLVVDDATNIFWGDYFETKERWSKLSRAY